MELFQGRQGQPDATHGRPDRPSLCGPSVAIVANTAALTGTVERVNCLFVHPPKMQRRFGWQERTGSNH